MKVQTPRIPLRDADPKGRLDVATFKLGEAVAKHCGAEKVWNGGLGDVVEALIENAGIPSKQITAVDVARELGIVRRR